MKTKLIVIDDHSFTVAKLTLDDIEAWETETLALTKGATSMSQVHAVQRKACAAALERGGLTPGSDVGRLDIDGLTELVAQLMAFSNMVTTPGEAPGTP